MTDTPVFVSPDDVMAEAARLFRVDEGQLRTSLALPYRDYRLAAVAVAREACRMSYPALGRALCRDHTTVFSACQRVATTPRLQRFASALQERVAGVAQQRAVERFHAWNADLVAAGSFS